MQKRSTNSFVFLQFLLNNCTLKKHKLSHYISQESQAERELIVLSYTTPLLQLMLSHQPSWNHTRYQIFSFLCLPQWTMMWTICWGIQAPLCCLWLHVDPDSSTWLPGISGLLECSEAKTKLLAPFLLSLRHSASVLLIWGFSSQLSRGGPSAIQLAHLWHRAALCSTLGKNTQRSSNTTQSLTTAELSQLLQLAL